MNWEIIAVFVLWCSVGIPEEPAADAPKEIHSTKKKMEATTQQNYRAIEKLSENPTPEICNACKLCKSW